MFSPSLCISFQFLKGLFSSANICSFNDVKLTHFSLFHYPKEFLQSFFFFPLKA